MRDLKDYQKKNSRTELQEIRVAKKLSQVAAGKAMGLSLATICRIETGAYAAGAMSTETRQRLVDFYGSIINSFYPEQT